MAAPVASPAPLDVHDEGTGPVVLLLHGVGGDRTIWNAVTPVLARQFRVLAPDLRGHGRTPAPPGSRFTLEELLGDVVHLLDVKEIPSAHWVGLSGGALLALRAGLDQKGRTRSVTMISGAAYTDAHTRSITERLAETYAKEGPDAYALRLLKDLYYPDWIEAHLDFADRVREGIGQRDLGPVTGWTHAIDRFDERNRVGTLGLPVLIVQGMDDAVIDPAHGRILRQSIPRAQIRILPQTGHMVPLERPQETSDAIRTFVSAVEGSPSA
ncbi:MAG: alpha/beta fold hydrolase [Thermoplasmata archaeon]